RWQVRGAVGAVSLRVAVGARPDGPHRRHESARALERLEARVVHEREHQTRLGLGEDGVLDGACDAVIASLPYRLAWNIDQPSSPASSAPGGLPAAPVPPSPPARA